MILPKETSIKLLNNLLARFKQLQLFPVIGAEIEFYLISSDHKEQNNLWQADKLDLDLLIEEERGDNQFEIKTTHSRDLLKISQTIFDLKNLITKQAIKQKMLASFEAKPFIDQPGSALHIHLHLENSNGDNLYIKKQEQETKLLLNSIGGLCESMLGYMLIFAPYEQAYLRYRSNSLEAPSKICWGINNRSAAIRLPLADKSKRRLEHRVACADSSAIEVICAILAGVLRGIEEELFPQEKIYGNAFLEQYDFPPLLKTYMEAKEKFNEQSLLKYMVEA